MYGMVIKPPRIFLLHISGSVDNYISFASLIRYSITITLIEEKWSWSICCCLSVSLYTCMLSLLCLPIWLYAKGNTWFTMFTLHDHHCSFITDKDLTNIRYTNLIMKPGKFQCLSMKHAVKQTASLCM